MNAAPSPSRGASEFQASLWDRRGPLSLSLEFAAITGLFLYLVVTSQLPVDMIPFGLMFMAMFLGSSYYAFFLATGVRLSPDGVLIRSTFVQRLVRDSDVGAFVATHARRDSIATIELLSGKKIYIHVGIIPNKDVLVALLEERFRKANADAVTTALRTHHRFNQTMNTQALAVLGVVAIICGFMAAFVPQGYPVPGMITGAVGVVLILLGLLLPKPRLEVSEEGITRKSEHIPWDAIDRVVLRDITRTSNSGARNTTEAIELFRGAEKILVSSDMYDNAELFRNIALSKIPSNKVTDQREGLDPRSGYGPWNPAQDHPEPNDKF